MLLWARWGDILSVHLQPDWGRGRKQKKCAMTTMTSVCLHSPHCHNNATGKHYNTLGELNSLNQYHNMIIFCSSAGTRVLNRIWQIRKQPALYSLQYCLAYLPFLPCIWRKPIRFKMCLVKDYLCWFPPSFLSQPVYNWSVHPLHCTFCSGLDSLTQYEGWCHW